MTSMWDTPMLHDPDEDNCIVVVVDVLPDAYGKDVRGFGIDVDTGEEVEWLGDESVMEKLLAKLREAGDEPVYALVNVMQERSRKYPTTKEQV
jgi:hypothetical protein